MTRTPWTRWFELNPDERRWMRVILAIFLFGLLARTVSDHMHRRRSAPGEAGAATPNPVPHARGR